MAHALQRQPAAHVRMEAEADINEVRLFADFFDRCLAPGPPHGGKAGVIGRHGLYDPADLRPAGFDAAGGDAVCDGAS